MFVCCFLLFLPPESVETTTTTRLTQREVFFAHHRRKATTLVQTQISSPKSDSLPSSQTSVQPKDRIVYFASFSIERYIIRLPSSVIQQQTLHHSSSTMLSSNLSSTVHSTYLQHPQQQQQQQQQQHQMHSVMPLTHSHHQSQQHLMPLHQSPSQQPPLSQHHPMLMHGSYVSIGGNNVVMTSNHSAMHASPGYTTQPLSMSMSASLSQQPFVPMGGNSTSTQAAAPMQLVYVSQLQNSAPIEPASFISQDQLAQSCGGAHAGTQQWVNASYPATLSNNHQAFFIQQQQQQQLPQPSVQFQQFAQQAVPAAQNKFSIALPSMAALTEDMQLQSGVFAITPSAHHAQQQQQHSPAMFCTHAFGNSSSAAPPPYQTYYPPPGMSMNSSMTTATHDMLISPQSAEQHQRSSHPSLEFALPTIHVAPSMIGHTRVPGSTCGPLGISTSSVLHTGADTAHSAALTTAKVVSAASTIAGEMKKEDLGRSTPLEQQGEAGSICRHFLEGKCNRRKCRFLHQSSGGDSSVCVGERSATIESTLQNYTS